MKLNTMLYSSYLFPRLGCTYSMYGPYWVWWQEIFYIVTNSQSIVIFYKFMVSIAQNHLKQGLIKFVLQKENNIM